MKHNQFFFYVEPLCTFTVSNVLFESLFNYFAHHEPADKFDLLELFNIIMSYLWIFPH